MRVMLYKMQGMLRRWRVLCKEQAVLQVDVLVAKLEDKEKRTAAPWVAGLSDTRAKLGESGSTGKFMEFWRSSSH